MKTRRWLLAAISTAALVLVPGAAQSATTPAAAVARAATLTDGGSSDWDGDERGPDRHRPPQPQPPPSTSFCKPGTPPNAPQTTQFFDNNPNLGPAQLPTAQPVGPLLAGYQRFGGLTEQQWLADYQGADGKLRYPPQNGFQLGPDGRPVSIKFELQAGYRIDRFGNPTGAFLSPVGTPYISRAIPPLNLNTPANSPLANYRSYCVLKPFSVDAGPAAAWFAQPGGGTQYVLNHAYVPQAGGNLNVTWLVANHFLAEEDLADAAAAVPSQTSASDAADSTGTPSYPGR